MSDEGLVLWFAILSRVMTLILAWLYTSLLSPYDSSGGALSPLYNWDGAYFRHIALNGYTMEQQHAFFPGYPLLLRALPSAFLVNCVAFLVASLAMFRLSLLFVSRRRALISSLLFCFTPAGVFMTAAYSESVYAALTICGMLLFYQGNKNLAAVMFAGASSVRSNSLLFILLFVWDFFQLKQPFQSAVRGALVAVPFMAFQGYTWSLYCVTGDRPWCSTYLSYGFIQSHYWGNGLFRYWTLRQLPNFFLATPTIALSARGIVATKKAVPGAMWLIWVIMVTLNLFTMHVQIATRFLAALPPIYWYCAAVERRWLVVCFFSSYWILGTILFPLYYPWT